MKQLRFVFNIILIIKKFRIAALLGGAAILFYACENNIEEIKAFSSPENLPVMEAENFQTLSTDSGEVRFSMKAPKLLKFENDGNAYIEFPEGVKLVKYDENGNIISSISADYARQYEKEKKWEAKNNVVATNAKGDTLKTELLNWEEKTGKIYSNEFVKIIRPDQIITGIGFESNQNLENWKIKNPKGTIYVNVEANKDSTGKDSMNAGAPPEKNKIDVQPFREPLDLKK